MTDTADRLYTILVRLVDQGRPLPTQECLIGAPGSTRRVFDQAWTDARARYGFRVQLQNGQGVQLRRIRLADGRTTPWPVALGDNSVVSKGHTDVPPPRVTAAERAMIDAAVAAGRVKRLAPVYEPDTAGYYRRPQSALRASL